jgi:two-component SAPR family response regulator
VKAILIDDEKPALLHLERLLDSDGRIRVTGKFTSAREGLDHLLADKAEIVFLDIEMPEMNGLEAAEYISQIDRNIKIVYTTAYSEYAIEAFELNALDYLLKPIHPDRLSKTVERVAVYDQHKASRIEAVKPDDPQVVCFKRLMLADSSGSGGKLRWRTMKAQELFAILLHHKGRWIDRGLLLDTMWPDVESDKAVTYLHTSISQVRKVLKDWGVEAAVEYAQESYRLFAEGIVTDVEKFEREVGDNPVITEQNREHYERVLELYRGDYLEEHDYSWAKPRSGELLERFAVLAKAIADYEMKHGNERQALRSLVLLQEKDPYSEEVCRLVLTAYAGIGDFVSLKACYEAFAHVLKKELGLEPEPQTKRLYEQLMRKRD